MVTLEQIKQLDAKVAKAVELISQLRQENKALTGKLGNYQQRIEELEILINEFKNSQGAIEEGILHALKELDKLEQSAVPIKAGEPPAAAEAGTEMPEEDPEPDNTEEESGTDPGSDGDVNDEEEADEDEEADSTPGSELDIF